MDCTGPAESENVTGWSLAERLLRIPIELSELERPEEFVERAAAALANALGADVVIRWFDVEPEPYAPDEPGSVRLIVTQQDAPFAAVDVTPPEPFTAETKRILDHVAVDLTHGINAISNRMHRVLQQDLRDIIRSEKSLEELTRSATAMGVERLGAEAAVLLIRKNAAFRAMASAGEWPQDPEAVTRLQEIAKTGIEAAGPMLHPGGFVTCPVATSAPARLVFLLRYSPQHPKHGISFPVLEELARVAAPYLDARWRDAVLIELLELNRASEETSTAEMYDRALRTAVNLVPGSEAGTLLTRATPDEEFEFQAALGFDLDGLRTHGVSEEEERAWYGSDERGWLLGLPRVLNRDDTDLEKFGSDSSPSLAPEVALYDRIQSTLCLPVLRDGEVMAVLNLDNLSDPKGFGRDSAQLAHLFGAPLASLLHRQQTRDLLRRAALTDELTGLANRRAFDDAVERELARSTRSGTEPSVLLMDLKHFKEINDRFGHDAGDAALVEVARALRESLRATDLPARRGGDEFVALLIETPAAEAGPIVQRVKDSIARIVIGDVRLKVNVGVATAPDDGDDAVELLRIADERMYLDKLGPR